MATFDSTKIAGRLDQPGGTGQGGDLKICVSKYSILAALAVGDVIRSPEFQAGSVILNVWARVPDLDTGTAIVLDIGYGGDTDYFVDGSTAGQTGGWIAGNNVATALPLVLTANDTIDMIVETAPTTGATSGDIYLYVLYLAPNQG